MLIAFPVGGDSQGESVIFEHFAAAPVFVTYDTSSEKYGQILNEEATLSAGSKNASDLLTKAGVNVVVAAGIGDGAINRLNGLGIEVFWSHAGMVEYDLKLFLSGKLAGATKGKCDGAFRQ
ncbi:Dinitrogenase iron-molybdenum cofactor biosynthesis protein [Denitrovibrio acetiphilus DSM 12809]|uniref:Dinitrogenase iron-molybdenum cofactor biosynthesis protein n=1 Tax=Denitrovibrio acetiphilus (strain DSM 12809 / NBRC 114555 / N2460) TaxID=522772 RepID=D4H3J8_DENA2|nr:NifB/NifX family molybdenum-iron cluster-binding protein [Denitrovibrio acetiphilus]ADD69100.1 Dinitrogenase iron-molybdenum cofactor biosynthesis protein [Denitrovibrio acetiphilus DSM 12809]